MATLNLNTLQTALANRDKAAIIAWLEANEQAINVMPEPVKAKIHSMVDALERTIKKPALGGTHG